MNKPNVIIHPYSFNQSDWVRLFLPFMQFMRANEFQVIPSFSTLPCLNKDYLKQTRAVILQKSNAPGRAQLALAYSNLKKECGFKLITDIDDLMWDLSPVIVCSPGWFSLISIVFSTEAPKSFSRQSLTGVLQIS